MRGRKSTSGGLWKEPVAVSRELKDLWKAQPDPVTAAVLAEHQAWRLELGLAHQCLNDAEVNELIDLHVMPEAFEPAKAEALRIKGRELRARAEAARKAGGRKSGAVRRETGRIANALSTAPEVMARLRGGKINAQQALNALHSSPNRIDPLPSRRALHDWKRKDWK